MFWRSQALRLPTAPLLQARALGWAAWLPRTPSSTRLRSASSAAAPRCCCRWAHGMSIGCMRTAAAPASLQLGCTGPGGPGSQPFTPTHLLLRGRNRAPAPRCWCARGLWRRWRRCAPPWRRAVGSACRSMTGVAVAVGLGLGCIPVAEGMPSLLLNAVVGPVMTLRLWTSAQPCGTQRSPGAAGSGRAAEQ